MAIIEGLPYLKSRSTIEMHQLGLDANNAVFKKIGNISELMIFAESQAAVATIETIIQSSNIPKKVILLSPLGMNPSAFGKNDKERYAMFLKKSGKVWIHKDQSLRISANRETLKFIAKDTVKYPHKIKLAWSFACKQDIVSQTDELASKIPVQVFAGERDELFPYDEITTEIEQDANVQVHSLGQVGRMNRDTKKGTEQFNAVYAIVG